MAEVYLRTAGYHRSGGYRYIFRKLLDPSLQDRATRTFRRDEYYEGSDLRQIRQVDDFDHKLRSILGATLIDFEVSLRAAIAHVLASKSVFAHEEPEHLDPQGVKAKRDPSDSASSSKFDALMDRAEKATRDSSHEDSVPHHLMKYRCPLPVARCPLPVARCPLPVWTLVEIISFGSLPYLYDLLNADFSSGLRRPPKSTTKGFPVAVTVLAHAKERLNHQRWVPGPTDLG